MRWLLISLFVCLMLFGSGALAYTIVSPPESLSVSAVVVGPIIPPSPSGGNTNGGSSGGSFIVPTNVTFSGQAYPFAKVYLLKDGQIEKTVLADMDAKFSILLNSNLSAGNYVFSLIAVDSKGNESSLFNIPVVLTANTSNNVSGIFISPTISVDKTTVLIGKDLIISGQSAPFANVIISIISNNKEFFVNTVSNANGNYSYNVNTLSLSPVIFQAKAEASLNGQTSFYSSTVTFNLKINNIFNKETNTQGCSIPADLNGDCRVNLTDFLILKYWLNKYNFPKRIDLNNDGVIDITDFSILAYYWTG